MMAEIQSLVEEIKNKNLVLDEEIGRGAFGVVYKGRRGACGIEADRAGDGDSVLARVGSTVAQVRIWGT